MVPLILSYINNIQLTKLYVQLESIKRSLRLNNSLTLRLLIFSPIYIHEIPHFIGMYYRQQILQEKNFFTSSFLFICLAIMYT